MAIKNGKDKKQEPKVRMKKFNKHAIKMSKQDKMDFFFEKEYRRKNPSHKNTKEQLSHYNSNTLATGKGDGNFKRSLNYLKQENYMNIYDNEWVKRNR